jgi:hypothetical protein
VDGYSISMYDVRSLANSIAAESDTVDDHLRELRGSAVTSADLGTGDVDGVAARYVHAVHGTLSDSLTAFRSASLRLAETLVKTHEHYETVEEGNRARIAWAGH